jgi:hypothetical protein
VKLYGGALEQVQQQQKRINDDANKIKKNRKILNESCHLLYLITSSNEKHPAVFQSLKKLPCHVMINLSH